MAQELQNTSQQCLHHFITVGKWCYSKLMDKITLDFWQLLQRCGLEDDTCFIIDDSGNPKKGKLSVGVKRKYCGQIGKTGNCQVGVFGALCGGSLVNLVQARLSLGPEATKIDLAKEIIDHVILKLKVKVKWGCFDAFYGRDDQASTDPGTENGVSYGIAAKGYRYGFNGKENDNDVKGEGNEQDYGMRVYDGRIGKILSVDPLSPKYPELTPYQFASNSPIMNVDLDGLEGILAPTIPFDAFS